MVLHVRKSGLELMNGASEISMDCSNSNLKLTCVVGVQIAVEQAQQPNSGTRLGGYHRVHQAGHGMCEEGVHTVWHPCQCSQPIFRRRRCVFRLWKRKVLT